MTKIPAFEASQSVKESCALHENQRIITKLTRALPHPVRRQISSVQALPSYLFNNQSNVVPTIYA